MDRQGDDLKKMARSRRATPAGVLVEQAPPCSRRDGGRALRARGALLAGGALLAVSTGLSLGGAPAQATAPGDNGKIICEGTRGTSAAAEIYTINPDGTGETVLTSNDVRDGDPSFSPDGKNIAFESFRDGNSEVYRAAADGSGVTRLTNTPAVTEDRSTSWSPDGTKIAFHSTRDPLPPSPPPGSSRFEIYIMNADGTNQTRITNNLSQDTFPAWSPDGTKLAFMSPREGNAEIYVVNRDGSGLRRLTNHPSSDVTPTWAPSGNQIAFTSDRTGRPQIWIMNADGSGQQQITRESWCDRPTWSPAPFNEIAYASQAGGGYDIKIFSFETRSVNSITNGEGSNESPAFSPNGRHIAFTSSRAGKYQVFTIDRDGNNLDK